jgi:hypothetical protein
VSTLGLITALGGEVTDSTTYATAYYFNDVNTPASPFSEIQDLDGLVSLAAATGIMTLTSSMYGPHAVTIKYADAPALAGAGTAILDPFVAITSYYKTKTFSLR